MSDKDRYITFTVNKIVIIFMSAISINQTICSFGKFSLIQFIFCSSMILKYVEIYEYVYVKSLTLPSTSCIYFYPCRWNSTMITFGYFHFHWQKSELSFFERAEQIRDYHVHLIMKRCYCLSKRFRYSITISRMSLNITHYKIIFIFHFR